MGWLDWIRGRGAQQPAPPRLGASAPDSTPFSRPAGDSGGIRVDSGAFGAAGGLASTARMIQLAAFEAGWIDETTRPDQVPVELLELMRCDPWIYLGERMFAAPLQDPSLYYVEHADPAIRLECEAWLRKLLPRLLRTITRAFAHGCSPYVLDWESRDVSFDQPREPSESDPRETFRRTLRGHQHYAESIHPLRLVGTELEVIDDDLVAVWAAGRSYRAGAGRAGRGFAAVWDPEPGCWLGNGSRRRAWRSFWRSDLVEILEGRWIERGVDPPRVGYAPHGTLTIDGEQVPATEILTSALMALKGGDAAVLPAQFDKDTNQPLWSVSAMQLPDVSSVWRTKLDSTSAEKLIASLVPPSSAGVGDATFAAARIPNEMFAELLESAASWVAEQVEAVTDVVHEVNYPGGGDAPEIRAREIPKHRVKRLMDVIRAVATVPRRVGDDREVTLAELVDESILDEAGVPRRETRDAAREPRGVDPASPAGRPREETGAREERRESAREPEGEDAVGAGGEGVDE